jgi:prepilin-type N-terminal cleavage/methylation domain-containing protein
MRDRILNKRNSSGLTLMELIITLAVIGTLLAIASPLMGQFSSGYRLRGAAREVATDLQFARLLAVKENRDFQVVFGSSSYQVVRVSPWLVVKSRDFSVDYPEVGLAGITVRFNSRGNCVSGATTTITVSNPRGTKNITVVSTGRVKLG